MNHLPPYLQKYDEFKAKGVDVIAVLGANDPYVMSGWGRVEGLKNKVYKVVVYYGKEFNYFQILALSDIDVKWSKQIGLSLDLSDKGLGLGVRTGRYALVIEDLVVKYIGVSMSSRS